LHTANGLLEIAIDDKSLLTMYLIYGLSKEDDKQPPRYIFFLCEIIGEASMCFWLLAYNEQQFVLDF